MILYAFPSEALKIKYLRDKVVLGVGQTALNFVVGKTVFGNHSRSLWSRTAGGRNYGSGPVYINQWHSFKTAKHWPTKKNELLTLIYTSREKGPLHKFSR